MASPQVIRKSTFLEIDHNIQYAWYMYKQSNVNENISYSKEELIKKFTYKLNEKLYNPDIYCKMEYI